METRNGRVAKRLTLANNNKGPCAIPFFTLGLTGSHHSNRRFLIENGYIPAKVEWRGGARRPKAVFFFVRDCLYQEGEGRSSDSFYRTARDARQGHRPFGTAPTALSPVRRQYHRRPRPATQAGTRLDQGATRHLSSVQQDLHDLARFAGAFGAFQLALPTAGL
jgi:hypothetical protein